MKKIFTIIISSLLLLSSVLTSCEKVDYTKVGTIYGIVTKEGSTEPLSAVPVGLYKDNSLMLQTVTYEDGHFEFTNLLAGYYNVRIDAMGYETQEFSVYVESQRVARADMQLKFKDIGISVSTENVEISSDGEVFLKLHLNTYKESCNELGFYYSKDPDPINNGMQVKIPTYSGGAELEELENGLYYYVAYARNKLGITYGGVKTFTLNVSKFEYEGQWYIVSPSRGRLTWEAAVAECDMLYLNGRSNWELPNLDVLEAMYYNRDKIGGMTNGSYWSSTVFSGDNRGYLNIYDNGHKTAGEFKNFTNHVRCVREID